MNLALYLSRVRFSDLLGVTTASFRSRRDVPVRGHHLLSSETRRELGHASRFRRILPYIQKISRLPAGRQSLEMAVHAHLDLLTSVLDPLGTRPNSSSPCYRTRLSNSSTPDSHRKESAKSPGVATRLSDA
jgi:hypothetical protein